MTEASAIPEGLNYYDRLFAKLIAAGTPTPSAVEMVADAYLDGRPPLQGKRKVTKKERDGLFWSSRAVEVCAPDAWNTETMVLALARYLGQEPTAKAGLVNRVAREAPDALIRAVRYSGIVLNQQSPRRTELDQAAAASVGVGELCRVLDSFDLAHRQRLAAVEMCKAPLADLSAFELLIYASLYAFEQLVPRDFTGPTSTHATDSKVQVAWDAINDLLEWKLGSSTASALNLNEAGIGRSVLRHLRPVLFDANGAGSSEVRRNLGAFNALMDAQIELNEFINRSAEAFCYDDGIRFVRVGDRLEIVEVDPAASAAWRRGGRKLERLHGYWLHRAIDEFVAFIASDPARWHIGRPENAEANRLAWVRALQAQLRLQEVYGVADEVTSESGETVNVFQALLSLDLMSAFFLRDFLAAFAQRLTASGDWHTALQQLAMDGLQGRMQNRLPLTWSDRDSKVANITGWTVTPSQPRGSSRMAAAILDFWSYDVVAIAERLQRHTPGLQPHLFERPVLKFGSSLVQLPWIVGMQNNSTAAINNLRRLGARRAQAKEETKRIEAGMARLLELRGFKVMLNWTPPRDEQDPGEVDVIAARDDHLFVLEVKSTFLRRSQKDAWLHASTTLRKAGDQLRRKMEAISRATAADSEFRAMLGLSAQQSPSHCHGWIVDTCIECDHQRFAGFLKISVEEMLIALRDDRHLLNDPEGLLAGKYQAGRAIMDDKVSSAMTLYPDGFSAERFVEVIETEAVWEEIDRSKT